MKINLCQLCKRKFAEHRHHLFSNSKLNRKLYGSLLDSEENIMLLCSECHLWKPIPKIDEITFCKKLKIEPKSKGGKEMYARLTGTC